MGKTAWRSGAGKGSPGTMKQDTPTPASSATQLIGVVSYQGDFQRHIAMLSGLGVATREVRSSEDLVGVHGVVLPGGESTTIGMLMERFGVAEALKKRAGEGMPVFGTCAGVILLAEEILNSTQPRLGLLPVSVERNAYGRQTESFEAQLNSPIFGSAALEGVFIRAPRIRKWSSEVDVLAHFEQDPILIRYGSILGATFHPELTQDTRIHRYFLDMVKIAHESQRG